MLSTLCRFLGTLHFITVTSVLYYYLVSNYANPAALATQDLWYVMRISMISEGRVIYSICPFGVKTGQLRYAESANIVEPSDDH